MTPEELEELKAITMARDAHSARVQAVYRERGWDPGQVMIATGDDAELTELVRDAEELKGREAAFWERVNA